MYFCKKRTMEQKNGKEIKSMIFIGNGFDVAHGYKTKYSDFYANSIELKNLACNGNTLCQHILDNVKGDLWQDLECGLFEYSKKLKAENGEGNKPSSDKFKKEFLELKTALFYYLKQASRVSVANNPGYKVGKLSEEWMRLEYQIVSFNYTAIVAAYTSDSELYNSHLSFNPDKLIFQHGSIYNPEIGSDNAVDDIVLGIDEDQKVEKAHSFLYKSVQNIYDINNLIKSIEEKDVYIVYGCSMGPSDSVYFKTLFDANKTDKTYIIYANGDSAMKSIKENVFNYAGGLNKFKMNGNNEIIFIDCTSPRALSETKRTIDNVFLKDIL